MSVPEMAGVAEDAIKTVMKVEPMVAGLAGMFVPGLFMVQPWIVMLAPYLEKALEDVKTGNNGDVLKSILDIAQHVSKGLPNSPALTPATQDPSAQGSG